MKLRVAVGAERSAFAKFGNDSLSLSTDKDERERRQLAELLSWQVPRQLSMDTWLRAYQDAHEEERRRVDDRLLTADRAWFEAADVATLDALAEQNARERATRATTYAGLPSWSKMRRLIYLRDDGVCWSCGNQTDWPNFELGHVVDRMAGGLDIPQNLAVMCGLCNAVKPLTPTIEAALTWRDAGGAVGQLRNAIEAVGFGPRELPREKASSQGIQRRPV